MLEKVLREINKKSAFNESYRNHGEGGTGVGGIPLSYNASRIPLRCIQVRG